MSADERTIKILTQSVTPVDNIMKYALFKTALFELAEAKTIAKASLTTAISFIVKIKKAGTEKM